MSFRLIVERRDTSVVETLRIPSLDTRYRT